MKKKLLISFALSVILTLGVVLFRVYWADPLHFYSLDTSKAKYGSNMRVQAAGLINNLDFDSVILGNSYMENTSCKEASEVLGGKFINVSLSGSNLYERAILLDRILSKGNIRTVYLMLSARLDKTGHGEYAIENWDYLYDSNRFNDIKYYFNSHDLMCILTFSKSNECVGWNLDLDRPNAWYTSPDHNSRFGGVENWVKYYTNDQLQPLLTEYIPTAIKNKSKGVDNSISPETIKQINSAVAETLEKFVKNYPQTVFYCYFNPDSLLSHSVENAFGSFGFYKGFVRETVKVLTPYQNVKIYGFDNLEFTSDISYYKDLTHYRPEVNSMLLKLIGDDKYRLSAKNVDSYLDKLTERVEKYDLVAFNEMIQKGIKELKGN